MLPKLQQMVARGVLKALVKTTKLAGAQVLLHRGGETEPETEYMEHAGFTSAPEAGAEAIVVHPFGLTDSPVVIVITDRRHRPTDLAEGETVVYAPKSGGKQIRVDDANIKLGDGASKKVARDGDPVVINGNTDLAWQAFLTLLVDAWNTAAASGGGPLDVPTGAGVGVISSITGRVDDGSDVVRAVD